MNTFSQIEFVLVSGSDGDALESETFSTYNTYSNSVKTNLWVNLKIIVKLCFPRNLKTGPTPTAFLERKIIPRIGFKRKNLTMDLILDCFSKAR